MASHNPFLSLCLSGRNCIIFTLVSLLEFPPGQLEHPVGSSVNLVFFREKIHQWEKFVFGAVPDLALDSSYQEIRK